jgi:hypothetical protein
VKSAAAMRLEDEACLLPSTIAGRIEMIIELAQRRGPDGRFISPILNRRAALALLNEVP